MLIEALRVSGALTPSLCWLLAGYYLLTPLSAFADAAAWLLLIRLVAGGGAAADSPALVQRLISWLSLSSDGLLRAVVAFFLAKAALLVLLTALETRLGNHVRRSLQRACLRRLISGRWEDLRNEQTGRWIGIIIEESAYVTKVVTLTANVLYTALTAAVLIALAFAVEPRLTLTLGLAAVPAWLLLRALYRLQNVISTRQKDARQSFTADLTETLSALFQVKAAGEHESARVRGLRRQEEIFRLETHLGYTLGVLTAFNPLAFGLLLLSFGLLSGWNAAALASGLATFGSVGVLGFRAASQVSMLVGAVGNLTRLSGSIEPIHRLVTLPQEREREPLPEPLAAIRLESVTYGYEGRALILERSAELRKGRLVLITGASGSGKTTLVNLIAGLLTPRAGRILYVGASGAEHDAAVRRARLGYVPQEVHVFSGSIRENVDPLGLRSDDEVWTSLRQAGAESFVRAKGGLDAEVAEGGRSLSGGERRRIGIARALVSEPDGLILDEITNGLDSNSKTGLMTTVTTLSRDHLVLAISHDLPAFAGAEPVRLELTA